MHVSCNKATAYMVFQQLHYNYNNTAVVCIYSIMRCVYHFLHGHICKHSVPPLFYTRFDNVTAGIKGVWDPIKQFGGSNSVYTFCLL